MTSGGGAEPGWYADAYGRHEHRYWDGRAWTDQVADGGRTAVDPPVPRPGPAGATTAPGGTGRRRSVGRLAVLAVVAAVVVVAVAVVALGGDDETPSSSADGAEDDEDRGQTVDGAITDDEPAVVAGIDLEAGDALRVVVETGGLDATAQLAVEEDALTDGFQGLLAPGGDDDLVAERLARQASILVSNISAGVDDEEIDVEDLDAMTDLLGDRVGGYEDAGFVFLGTDRVGTDEPEGLQFVAPTDGHYSLVVSGYAGSRGDYEVAMEVVGNDDAGLDPEDIDHLDYLALYAEHVEAFCDEDFFGGDPEDVTNYGPTVCDPDTLEGVLAGELNGDFTNDFGGGEGG